MKVTVVYDFTVEVTDSSNDKVYMEMSYKEFEVIKSALIEAECNHDLEDYDTYHKLHEEMNNHEVLSKN